MKKKVFFLDFSGKYGKTSKEEKNEVKGRIDGKEKIDEKWEKYDFFGFLWQKYGKISESVKNDGKGQILMKKAKVDKKWKNIFELFQENMDKCQKR